MAQISVKDVQPGQMLVQYKSFEEGWRCMWVVETPVETPAGLRFVARNDNEGKFYVYEDAVLYDRIPTRGGGSKI